MAHQLARLRRLLWLLHSQGKLQSSWLISIASKLAIGDETVRSWLVLAMFLPHALAVACMQACCIAFSQNTELCKDVLADVMELQQQFEQDTKKIAEWKASRRFKPY